MEFEPVIGLEVHAQLLTRSKLFCGCSTLFGAPANAHTCPVCLGLPGALPVVNRVAVGMATRAALALGCRINETSIFARKNYFYPDLPKGYQISQFDRPLGEHGSVKIYSRARADGGNTVDWQEKSFHICRLHMEEDAGKSLHDGMRETEKKSYVNLNRSGVPLIEIVSEPDFRSSQEAYDYFTQLRKTLIYLGVSDGNMEQGSLRCDGNVSVRPMGVKELGTKVEIKNLNSFRFLQRALDYEICRQTEELRSGRTIHQETRLWDESKNRTFTMRSKEEAHDYRYFPEPDLPPLELDRAWIDEIASTIPELPHEKFCRFLTQYDLSPADAILVTATIPLADYFEECAEKSKNPRATANWVTGELAHASKDAGREIEDCPVPAGRLAALIRKIDSGEISGKMGKTVFEQMYKSGEEPEVVIERLGMSQISTAEQLEPIVRAVIDANEGQAAEYRAGKEKVLGYFVGQVMKETKGQANPKICNELLRKLLRE